MTITKSALASALVMLCAVAMADEYDADYLTGTRSLKGKSQCRDDNTERVVLGREGGVPMYNDGRLESMRFDEFEVVPRVEGKLEHIVLSRFR